MVQPPTVLAGAVGAVSAAAVAAPNPNPVSAADTVPAVDAVYALKYCQRNAKDEGLLQKLCSCMKVVFVENLIWIGWSIDWWIGRLMDRSIDRLTAESLIFDFDFSTATYVQLHLLKYSFLTNFLL